MIDNIVEQTVELTWIPVELGYPLIPKGKHAVSVLVSLHDYMYEELNPGHGSYTSLASFFRPKDSLDEEEFDFYQLCPGPNGFEWMSYIDEVTHWAYEPKPIQLKGKNDEK